MNASLHWSSFLPEIYLAGLAAAAVAVLLLAKWRRVPDFYARGIFFLLLCSFLLNPIIVKEVRRFLPDKLLIVMDDSPSMAIAARNETAEKALARIKEELVTMPGIDPVIIRAGQDAVSLKNQNTSLFSVLKDHLIGLPAGQVAGTVLITDGQVHDVPETLGALEKLAPFHAVLTGKKDEFDRKVSVVEAPKYGLLSQPVMVKVRVDDIGRVSDAPINLTVRQDGNIIGQYPVTAGETQEYTFNLSHPGQNVIEFSVPAEKGEMTEANNTAAVIVNAVRDRLRVLLVSGTPHVGERAWRDLLKSDPAIDLVHFTILRSPLSFDNTPTNEMALIAFPVEELFERKIRDFDLIIFDKYAQYGLLQQRYFVNIASFVKQGGAFLMAMGSDEMEESIFKTAVGDILPVAPKKEGAGVVSEPYLPQLTDTGKTHPVTGDLPAGGKSWGRWFSQADVSRTKGQVLMTGAGDRPLLILDKVGEGRVAVLSSDNIWLWSKGAGGGGPYTDLLRNVAHWLMKEPELDEGYIKAEVKGNAITVSMRDLTSDPKSVTVTPPDRKEETLSLLTKEKGWISANFIAGQNGVYRFSSGAKDAFAVVGSSSAEEFSDVHTTEDKLKPVVDKTRGAMIWYQDAPHFSLKEMRLKRNRAYSVSGVESGALFPGWLILSAILGGLFFVWRREGRG